MINTSCSTLGSQSITVKVCWKLVQFAISASSSPSFLTLVWTLLSTNPAPWLFPVTTSSLNAVNSLRSYFAWTLRILTLLVSLFSPKLFLPLDSLTSHFLGSLLFYLPTFQTLWHATISTLILNQPCYPKYFARFHFPLFFTLTPKQSLFSFHQGGQLNVCMLQHLSCAQLFATLWTTACQVPLSLGFSRQECWSGLLWPSPEDLPNPGIEPTCLMSPALAGGFFTTSAPGKPR